jgi:hypothetical protein
MRYVHNEQIYNFLYSYLYTVWGELGFGVFIQFDCKLRFFLDTFN